MSWLSEWLNRIFGKKKPPPPPPPPPGDLRSLLFAAVNEERKAQGKRPFTRDYRLDLASQQWAEQIARDGRQYHSPTFDVRIRLAGYPEIRSEENVHGGPLAPTDPVKVVADWMYDLPHRSTIFSVCPDAGVGVVQDGNGDLWWVLDVASQR